jgi:putative holliday junction resolvase
MDSESPNTDAHQRLPSHGALLGLDYGTKRLGIATCNSDQTVAVPVETWQVRTPEKDLKHLRELIADYRAVGIVLGLPIRTDGTEGTAAAAVRTFGDWVAAGTGLPLVYVDERYSSAEAELLIWRRGESPSKRKQPLDSLAAHVILQSYLDAPDRIVPPPSPIALSLDEDALPPRKDGDA